MRTTCTHKLALPRGLRCDHGYLQIRIMQKGMTYFKNFGPHNKESQQIAEIHLAEKRKEILMGKFGLTPELPSYSFAKVAKDIYLPRWKDEINPDGTPAHSEAAIATCTQIVGYLSQYFGKEPFETIKGRDVKEWRRSLILRPASPLSSTTVDRYQGVLSSIYSHVSDWIATEMIKPFKQPATHPCEGVSKSPVKVRDRILTDYELKKLKMAFLQLNDPDGWEICRLALKTVLNEKDLRRLEIGAVIDIKRAKSGVPVNLPIPVLVNLNWGKWRTRWEAARKLAGLEVRLPNGHIDKTVTPQCRDLRKTGITYLAGQYDIKLVSQYAGHAKQETTERHYTVAQSEKLRPLGDHLNGWVEGL